MDYGVRGVFLDIAKAFDKVSHVDFIIKLSDNDISEKSYPS